MRLAKYRFLDPASGEAPGMPLVVGLRDGEHVAEADSPAGAVAAIAEGSGVAKGYEELDDAVTAWHVRRRHAERLSVALAGRGRYIAVEDQHKERFGPVFDPAEQVRKEAEDEGNDPDAAVAEIFPPGTEREVVRIDGDRIFLATLLRLKLIDLLERKDCRIMRPSSEWDALLPHKGASCRMCLYRDGHECVQFGIDLSAAPLPEGGAECGNFAPRRMAPFGGLGRVEGAEYADLASESLVVQFGDGKWEVWPPGRMGPAAKDSAQGRG